MQRTACNTVIPQRTAHLDTVAADSARIAADVARRELEDGAHAGDGVEHARAVDDRHL
jgi:hypothetical protein